MLEGRNHHYETGPNARTAVINSESSFTRTNVLSATRSMNRVNKQNTRLDALS